MNSETASLEKVYSGIPVPPPSTNGKVKWSDGKANTLNPRQIMAATLIAEAKLTLEEIATKVGCHRQAIMKWKRLPKFQHAVTHHREVFAARVTGSFLGQRMKRVKLRDDLTRSLIHTVKTRAHAATKDKQLLAAGGATGLIVSKKRRVGRETVREFEVDHGTIDQFRNLMREQAIDVGEWAEKKDVGGSVKLVVKRVIGVSEDEI